MIASVEDPKELDFYFLKQPSRINRSEFTTATESNLNTRNLMAFLDAETERAETKLKNIIPFKNHSKTIATLRYKPGKACIGSVWGKKITKF